MTTDNNNSSSQHGAKRLRLGDVAETDAQKRDAVKVTMSSQIEKLNGNIAKPQVSRSCGYSGTNLKK